MEVILQENMPALGKAGEVVRVKDGYARNFLLPQGKAVMADPANIRMLEHQKRQAVTRQEKQRAAAEVLARKMQGQLVTIRHPAGPEGRLFGAVTAQEIAEVLTAQGTAVDRRQIRLPEPLKQIGEHPIEVRVRPDVTAIVTVVVEAKG